jgi:hypothetical protein
MSTNTILFGQDVCANLGRALKLELHGESIESLKEYSLSGAAPAAAVHAVRL